MTTALSNRNIDLVPGGDYYCRSYDPLGAYMRSQFFGSNVLPIITQTSATDQTPSLGSTYVATFTSQVPCSWRAAYMPSDDATLTISADCKTATATWVIPGGARKTSEYVGVIAETNEGAAIKVDRVHVGATSLRSIGSGGTYATLAAAISGAPSGTRFVILNGTYTDTLQFVKNSGTVLPNGVFTTYTSGGSTRYTVTEFTTYMAESPLDVILDGSGTIRPINILGNHDYEQEMLDYDTANGGGTQFLTPVSGAITRVGIAIKGFHIIGSSNEAIKVFDSRFVHIQYCSVIMAKDTSIGIYGFKTNDLLIENCFVTGKMQGAFGRVHCLRTVVRRCGSTLQNRAGANDMAIFNTYETRQSELWNCFDIDGKDAYQFQTGTSVKVGSFVFPETSFNADGYTPDFSQNVVAGRFIAVNNYLSALNGGAWEYAEPLSAYTFSDIVSWDNTIYQTGYSTITGGPFPITNITMGRVNNQTGDNYLFRCLLPPQVISNGLFKNMGWNGTAAVDQGYVWNGRTDLLTPDSVDNFVLADTVATQENPANAATFTNQITSTDTALDGFSNLTRMQINSRFNTLNIGVQDAWKIHGKLGTFYGDTGYDAEVDRDWTDTFPHEKIAGLLRAYTYTGATRTIGTQTLSGNRGWARTDTSLREYLDKYPVNGATIPVHYPYESSVQVISGIIYVFVRAYYSTIREHRIYIDGKHAITLPASYHCAQITPLPAGTYSVSLTCVDNDGVESIYSRATSVTI